MALSNDPIWSYLGVLYAEIGPFLQQVQDHVLLACAGSEGQHVLAPVDLVVGEVRVEERPDGTRLVDLRPSAHQLPD